MIMGTKNKSKDQQLVISYLNQLELKSCRNEKQYWSILASRHDKATLEKLDRAFDDRVKGNNLDTLYDIKNQNLRLSLDIDNFSADLYRQYFDWFMTNQKDKSPKKILDIGCENGIVSCFYAIRFPEAEVIGIDIQQNAISCAKELASQLEISNISFITTDLRDIKSFSSIHSFDLITSLRSFHEIIGGFVEPPRHWSITEILEMDVDHTGIDFLRIVNDLLKEETSQFINCERHPSIGSLLLWGKALNAASLNIHWDESRYIKFHEVGNEQQFPVLVATKQASELSLLEGIFKISIKDQNSFISINSQYENELAEILFHQIENKDLVYGVQINFNDNSGKMRLELWKSEDIVILYQYSNIGYRKLQILSASQLLEAKKELVSTIPTIYTGQEILTYETVDSREAIK
jgi:2-polyprenyl-3-methyl-5-hydroxy-6-metoxy-1,4-benzoquinol methylase